jgi:LysM repeat protein
MVAPAARLFSSIISLAMRKFNHLRVFLGLAIAALSLLLAVASPLAPLPAPWISRSVLAAPAPQVPIYTPTPLPDGRIIYTVKQGDSLLSISLVTGVPVDELRKLNNLTGDTIYVGQQLLLGLAGPPQVTFTPGPSPTPTAFLPSPTTPPGTATLCVLLFDDQNGDSVRQAGESTIPDGAISISNRTGSVSLTGKTVSGTDPYCFDKVPVGEYNVTVAIPEGYNPTTALNLTVQLNAEDQTYINFGAQLNSANQEVPAGPTETGGRSPILGIIGGLLLAAGVGLALVAGRLVKGR